MKHALALLLSALTLLAPLQAVAAVNVERHGSENPVQEIAKSALWGAVAGLLIGGALAVADDSDEDSGYLRWGFAGGVLVGTAFGVWHVTRRPSGALLDIEDGNVHLATAPFVDIAPATAAGGGARSAGTAVRLVAVRF